MANADARESWDRRYRCSTSADSRRTRTHVEVTGTGRTIVIYIAEIVRGLGTRDTGHTTSEINMAETLEQFTREKAELAFAFRAAHNSEEAKLFVEVIRTKKYYERLLGVWANASKKSSVAGREAEAEQNPDVEAAHEAYCQAVFDHRELKGKMELAEMKFDGWRSANKANVGLDRMVS